MRSPVLSRRTVVPDLAVRDVGRMRYGEALDLQLRLVEERRAEQIPDTLILVEHPPVITMGRKATDADILAPVDQLASRGVEVHRITRGGEATYHGPGQIVGYTIMNLYNHQRKLRQFVERMEEIFIGLLGRHYDIAAGRDDEHRGVWVGTEKITAIGIAVTRGITMHGFAFNVDPDLSHFTWIVPCGIRDRGVTSLARILTASGRSRPDYATVKRQVVKEFCAVYGYDQTS
ncbi:MAG: lipoyl(octanoyl) transferase LipB [Spirochaetaceae bacterium]|nr:MAG: lipoyl(octanoyl) transferase LipB [Spirochaetaceae bacterium]